MKKKIKIIFFLVITIACLGGCGKAELGTDVKINKDGSSESTVRVAYDKVIGTIVNNDLLTKIVGDEFGEVKKYSKDDLNVEEVTIKTDKIKTSDLINTFKSLQGTEVEASELNKISEYINLDVETEKGLFFNTYEVKASIKDNVIDKTIDQVRNINSLTSTLVDTVDENVRGYLGNIPYTLTVNIPFEIVESNGKIVDSNTVKWEYTLADLNPNTYAIVSFKIINILNVCIMGVVLLIVIASAVIVIKKNKK